MFLSYFYLRRNTNDKEHFPILYVEVDDFNLSYVFKSSPVRPHLKLFCLAI